MIREMLACLVISCCFLGGCDIYLILMKGGTTKFVFSSWDFIFFVFEDFHSENLGK